MKSFAKRDLKWIILLLMFCAVDSKAACSNWSRNLGRPNDRRIYAGMLGGHPIRMMLHLDEATGRFDGGYGYANQPQMLTLSGDMQSSDAGVTLLERDEKGRITGRFDLKFFLPYQAGQYEKLDHYGCDYLTGTWQPSVGAHPLSVSLITSGELVPADDSYREENEATAYRLRESMLKNDRVTFASLLKYPFTSYSGMQIPAVWNNQEEVINNYKKIVKFERFEIQASVPHALQTFGSVSLFMNTSIELRKGKVYRICEGACPVSP